MRAIKVAPLTATPARYAVLEAALNRWLGLDPLALGEVEALSGRVLGVEVAGAGRSFYLSFAGSTIHIGTDCGVLPDAMVRGAPASLVRMLLGAESTRPLALGEVIIEGDQDLVQRFKGLLTRMEVDWEEELSKVLGDVMAHELGRLGRGAARWAGGARRTAALDVQEYLTEELRLVVPGAAFRTLADDVDTLRDDVERLDKRVERLARRLREITA